MTGYGIYLLSANDYAETFSELAYALVGSGILAIVAFLLGLTTWYKTYFTTAYIVRTSSSTTYSTRYIVLLVAVTIAGTVLGSLTIINLDHIEVGAITLGFGSIGLLSLLTVLFISKKRKY
ncbi:unnamed protein product [Rodentolepis nana]|uniref:ABC transporter permease n=1 Tax=Rodentolepis nana TaxID=102285 RepID=A0A0R3TQU9_RODNA|nr:unnamed protein product [Rodentolepis nana]